MAVPVKPDPAAPARHRGYPALSRPLTVLGCERRLFLGAAGVGAGRLATRRDPCVPAVLLRSAACGRRYNPALRSPAPEPLRLVREESA